MLGLNMLGLGLAQQKGGGEPSWLLRDENGDAPLLQFGPGQYWYDGTRYATMAAMLADIASSTLTVDTDGTYVNSSGSRVNATSNVLRENHDAGGNSLGFLLEGSSANRFLNSSAAVAQSVNPMATATSVSMLGTGSLEVTGDWTGTATEGSPVLNASSGVITVTPVGEVTHAQVEAGNTTGRIATSPITTAGAAVTRDADILRLLTASISGFSDTAGTIVVHARKAPQNNSYGQYLFSLDDTTSANAISFYGYADGVSSDVRVSNVGQQSVSKLVGLGQPFAAALAWAENDVAISVNGETETVDASAAIPTVSRLAFNQSAGGLNPWNGHLNLFAYWPRRIAALHSRSFFLSSPAGAVHVLGDSFANPTFIGYLKDLLGGTTLTADSVGGSSLQQQDARWATTPYYYGDTLISNDQLTLSDSAATTLATYAQIIARSTSGRFLIMEPSFPNGSGFDAAKPTRDTIWAAILAEYPDNVALATAAMQASSDGGAQDEAFVAAGTWPASCLANPGVTNDPADVIDGHLSAKGWQIYAQCAYDALVAKGWD